MAKRFTDIIPGLLKAVFALTLAAAVCGCGKQGYNAVLKSNDPDLMYRKALEYYDMEKYSRTIQLFELIGPRYRNSERADSAAYFHAKSYYKTGDFQASGILLDDFRQTYTLSPFLEDVEWMYAKGFYIMSPPANRDQGATLRALMAYDEYLNRYPDTPDRESMQDDLKELNQKLHDKAFINAESYYKTRNYKAAVIALRNALTRYPESSHREEIMFLMVKSQRLLAHHSVEEMQRQRYLDVMDYYYSFALEFPDSDHMRELEKYQTEAKEYLARFSDLERPDETAARPE